MTNLESLIGKTIQKITTPKVIELRGRDPFCLDIDKWYDDNILIEFTDGTVFKMASWDAEGYKSGIYTDIN